MSQYTENPYYPNGGAGGGGGFLAGGSPYGSTSGTPGTFRKTTADHSLRPVTIKQLYSATQAHTDAEWMIDGFEVGQISVVAQVMQIQTQTTNCVYWLDDGSGRMEARHWVDSSMTEEDENDPNAIKDNTYIRVMGGIKAFGNKRYINATHLRPCKDEHEFYFHVMEAMTTKLALERGPPPKPGQQSAQRTPMAGGQQNASAYTAQSHGSAANAQYAHLPELERKIVEFMLSQPPDGDGIHVGAIARAVGGTAAVISNTLDHLMDEGHVYSTIDESHYAMST